MEEQTQRERKKPGNRNRPWIFPGENGTVEKGVLILDKPQGITSFDVVYKLRRITGQRKIGHTGTLDPMATGVLPLLLGKAARAESFCRRPGRNMMQVSGWGWRRIRRIAPERFFLKNDGPVPEEALKKALERVQGRHSPGGLPLYSALKRNGKKLYEFAREGIVVEREPRPVTIYKLELLEYREKEREGRLLVRCSGGYVYPQPSAPIWERFWVWAAAWFPCGEPGRAGFPRSRLLPLKRLPR